MERSYYTKKTVYADEPLKEVIYEIEDIPTMDVVEDGDDPISRDVVKLLLRRHSNTIEEYYKRNGIKTNSEKYGRSKLNSLEE